MILTGKENIFKKWWSYILTFPGLFIIYMFALSNKNALIQYKLVYTSLGWINEASNNFAYLFFYIYYLGYTLIGLVLLWHWRRKNVNAKNKSQTNILFYSSIITMLIAIITDIIGNLILGLNIPQIAPVIILIPVMSICYCIAKYNFMNRRSYENEEVILNEANRARIYKHLSTAFIAGSFVFFISQYLLCKNADLFYVLLSSAALLCLGLAVKILQNLKLNDNYKSGIIILAMVITVPIITVKFISIGSLTVWAFPFLFIVIALLLNKSNALIFISISIMATQIFVWIMEPQVKVTVDSSDHIARIGLFAIGIWLAFFVNKIYMLRLKENIDQAKFQTLISNISTNFVTINTLNFDEKINTALSKCGKHFRVDRTSLAVFDLEQNVIRSNHNWQEETIDGINVFQEISLDIESWWIKQLLSNNVVNIPNHVNQSEIIKNTCFLTKNVCHSLLFIPIRGNNEVLGFLELSMVERSKFWRNDQMNLLKIITNVFADALVKVKSEKEINTMAYYDHLTNLPNRILLKDRVEQAIHLAKRTEKILGIIFLDLDSFKAVNDAIGYEGGDKLLKKVADQILQCLRKSDTVCRFGGDEFIIMLNNISNRDDIVRVADKLMTLFNQEFTLKGEGFFISASAGIANYPEDGLDTETLIKNANIAMHKAKDMGKNQYMLCSAEMKEELHTKIRLTNSLYHAKERNELYLHYQPQVCLKTKEIIGFEALIRWNHPKRGIISPSIFIPLAEQNGAINSIGEWALETACRQNKLWQNLGFKPMRMAVNLSVNQFRNPNLVEQIAQILKKTDLDPKYLELEITESITIKEEDYIVSVLNRLKELGVSIAIDDFGTEYSSLSRLKILPVDRIKIDMQFVKGIEGNDKDRVITDSIINLAKNLGLSVIAEGVENETQLEFLNQKMCNEVQGYYLYKPMSSEEIEAIL
jgi:diguanylate cyclase (GGDEF)-like protein